MLDEGAEIKVTYKNYPIDALSVKAAVADVCAESKDFHRLLSSFNGKFSERDIFEVAELIGVDMSSFYMCIDSAESMGAVKKDYHEGKSLGVNSVPDVFVNGKRIDSRKLKEEIKKLKEDL